MNRDEIIGNLDKMRDLLYEMDAIICTRTNIPELWDMSRDTIVDLDEIISQLARIPPERNSL